MTNASTTHEHLFFFPGSIAAEGHPEVDVLGGKGINLCKMSSAAFPVPPGLVVTTSAYREFVTHNRLDTKIRETLGALTVHGPEEIDAASVSIRAAFEQGAIPERLAEQLVAGYENMRPDRKDGALPVAVRSSATAEDLQEAAFAGQQDTYLNVRGKDSVLKAVKSCWGSLWTARAITYRMHKGFANADLALAVVVQQMIHSEASGVIFTANPVTGARDEIVINAAWGLGEAIVSGKVTPDTIVVEKTSGAVKSEEISEKVVMTVHTDDGIDEREITGEKRHGKVLDDAHIARLAEIARKVEKYYAAPQDLEWCLAEGEIYLVQARPITSLPPEPLKEELVEAVRVEEVERLRGLAGNRQKVWVIHNLAETVLYPTPLTWAIIKRFMSGDGGFGRMYQDFGFQPSRRVKEEGFLELIGGKIFSDIDRAPELFWEGMPVKYDVQEVLADPAVLETAPSTFDAEQADETFLLRLPRTVWGMIGSHFRTKKARKEALDRFDVDALPAFKAYLERARSARLDQLTFPELVAELKRRVAYVMDDFGKESLKPGFFGGTALGELRALLDQILGPQDGERVTQILTSGLEGNSTLEQNTLLYEVIHKRASREEFIKRYGHRAVEEMELARPRYREDESFFSQLSATMANVGEDHAPQALHQRNVEKRLQTMQELMGILTPMGGSSFYEQVRDLAEEAQKLLPFREVGKHYLMMGYETIRSVIVELGRRLDVGGDVFFLNWEDLDALEGKRAGLADELERRKMKWRCYQRLDLPDVIDSKELESLGKPRVFEHQSQLKAASLSSGTFTGTARIVRTPSEAKDLGPECILVCPSTDPSWTALFTVIKGLVVERGGVLSHGAITARDFGIPAVACANATNLIRDGARICLDGERGSITIVSE